MKSSQTPINLLLPEGILEWFEVVDYHRTDKDWHIFLDERAIPPADNAQYNSKGFTEQAVIQDFPLRGKPLFLYIRRRKWLNVKTKEVVTSSFVYNNPQRGQ